MKRRQWLGQAAAVLGGTLPTWASARRLPVELKLIVPSSPGGAPDVVARTLGQALERQQGVGVVVNNLAGANGELGVKRFKSAPTDGSTWLLAWDSVVLLNPLYYPREQPGVLQGLAPLAMVANNSACFIVVNANDGLQRLEDLIDAARRASVPLAYGSGGVGGLFHVMTEDLAFRLGMRLRHIPYRSNPLALADLLAGEVRFIMAGISVLPQIQSGRLRVLAVTSPSRQPAFPDVPALAEFLPGFEVVPWFGLFGSPDTDSEQWAQMGAWVDEALLSEGYRADLAARGGFGVQKRAGVAFAQDIERQHRALATVVARLPKESDTHVR